MVAVALSLTSAKISVDTLQLVKQRDLDGNGYFNALKDMTVNFKYDDGVIVIQFPGIFTRVRDLVDYVRPVGMTISYIASDPMNINSDVMLLYADTDVSIRKYNPVQDSGVSKNFVNFSTVGDPNFSEQLNQFSGDQEEIDMNG